MNGFELIWGTLAIFGPNEVKMSKVKVTTRPYMWSNIYFWAHFFHHKMLNNGFELIWSGLVILGQTEVKRSMVKRQSHPSLLHVRWVWSSFVAELYQIKQHFGMISAIYFHYCHLMQLKPSYMWNKSTVSWNNFKIISATLNMLEDIRELQ